MKINPPLHLLDKKSVKFGGGAVILVIMALLPRFVSSYSVEVMWNALFYMMLALGLNIIVGYTGLCDLGFAAKFAVGSYTTGILMKSFEWNFWATLPVCIVVSALVAVLIGAPTLKLRSDYLAVVTLGFAEIVRLTANNLQITGAASGLSNLRNTALFGMRLKGTTHWYYVFLGLVLLFIFISYRVRNSRFGRALSYVREDEDAAQAMGVDTTKYKLYAYMLGAVLGGLTGSFYAAKMASVAPGTFNFNQSINILLVVILGGMGKIPGVVVGAAFFALFPELLRSVPNISIPGIGEIKVADMRMLFFGILLVIVMITRPQGLWPERRKHSGKGLEAKK
ncbi:MAG: branched-chain amino acid ABC transporter permease [Clostridia bacterium]|nr:branched-chain amino acid ABC transporter permease [Clostridia bacterium]